jgi:rare lipoprotein A
MVLVMVRGTPSRGTKKCRKSTDAVDSISTMQIISIALLGYYFVLHHIRNEFPYFRGTCSILPGGIMREHFVRGFVAISVIIVTVSGACPAEARSHGFDPGTVPTIAGWGGDTGTASYYGPDYHGRRAASGLVFDQEAMTAAHPWLPFGTRVKVSLPATGRAVIVTITDRLHAARRIIDLSVAAARHLGMIQRGLAEVTIQPA